MGSTRLAGKVLRDLEGEPMLARVVERTRRAALVDEVVVATSTLPADDAIAGTCAARGWSCFRGSESDVLERYLGAARAARAEVIVRITSDCPLIDPSVTDDVIRALVAGEPELDYTCNFHPRRTYPRGLDAEAFPMRVLEECHAAADDPASREHVTLFIYRHPDRFRLQGLEAAGGDWSDLRWTVDTPEDFALAAAVYHHFGHDRFTWREVLAALEEHPEWKDLNRHIEQKHV